MTEPIDVRANVTKPFFSQTKGRESRDDALNIPSVQLRSPRAMGCRCKNSISFRASYGVRDFFLSTCVHAFKWSRMKRIFRCKCKVTFLQSLQTFYSFTRLSYGLMCACNCVSKNVLYLYMRNDELYDFWVIHDAFIYYVQNCVTPFVCNI